MNWTGYFDLLRNEFEKRDYQVIPTLFLIGDERAREAKDLLQRIVAMLTKLGQ